MYCCCNNKKCFHFRVGSIPFRLNRSVFSRIFYPTLSSTINREEANRIFQIFHYGTSKNNSWQYTRPEVIDGLVEWSNLPRSTFLKPLESRTLEHFGFTWALEVDLEHELPVIIFSHGLTSNADNYSKLATEVAKHGCIVVVLEHEDGSATYAYDVNSQTPIFYNEFPKSLKYDRRGVIEFRESFYQKRKIEILQVVEYLRNVKNLSGLELKIFSSMNLDCLILGGHSFGAVTVARLLQDLESINRQDFVCGVLLDVWSLALSDDVLKTSITTPILSLLSQEYKNITEFPLTQELLNNCSNCFAAYFENIGHGHFSDGLLNLHSNKVSIDFYKAIGDTIHKFITSPTHSPSNLNKLLLSLDA